MCNQYDSDTVKPCFNGSTSNAVLLMGVMVEPRNNKEILNSIHYREIFVIVKFRGADFFMRQASAKGRGRWPRVVKRGEERKDRQKDRKKEK